jgi:hypothetical protein
VEKEKNMKLVLRILPTVFALISITAFADTTRVDLNANVLIGANVGAGDNVLVNLSGQGVSIFAIGGTPRGFFDCCDPYFPGDHALGPTTIFWDTAGLQIGSTGYDFDQFDLSFTDLEAPMITFPTNGKDFTVSFPWTWELDGTIGANSNTTCPSSGCNFSFVSEPGTLSFSFTFDPHFGGVYFAGPASFSTPEPGTLGLMAAGLAGILAVFKRRKRAVVF